MTDVANKNYPSLLPIPSTDRVTLYSIRRNLYSFCVPADLCKLHPLPIKNISPSRPLRYNGCHFTERRPSLLRVRVEAHQVELVHLAEVDAHARAEPAREALHQVAPVRVEQARVGVDDLVKEIIILHN